MDYTNLSANVDTLFHSLENFTQKEGILGKPVEQGDKTLIPVLSVTLGYGSGNTAAKGQQPQSGMSDNSSGGALGLGAKLSTDAVLIIDNNNVSMLPVGGSGNVSQLIDKIPQMVMGMNPNKQNQNQSQATGQA